MGRRLAAATGSTCQPSKLGLLGRISQNRGKNIQENGLQRFRGGGTIGGCGESVKANNRDQLTLADVAGGEYDPPMMPPLLLANLLSTYGLAAALAVVCLIVLRGNWFKQQRSKAADPDPDEIKRACAPKPRDLAFDTAPKDVLGWQVEMHEMARDLKGDIDTKLLALQTLMIVAREHCERLESLIARAEQTGLRTSPALSGREVLQRIEDGSHELPTHTPAGQNQNVLTAAQADRAQRLARQDWTPQQIAREVGASLGDVELFLSLHQ